MIFGPGKHPAQVPSAALVRLVHGERGHMSERQNAEGVQSVVARWIWERHESRLRKPLRVHWAVAAAVAMTALVAAVVAWRGTRVLSYAVDGGRVEPSGFITAQAADPPRLRFSDGTEVRLGSETKASLRSVDGRGARVSLADGIAQVDVKHLQGARWLFDAGPFLIAVTGTAFTLEWRSGDERLDVRMLRGSVRVSGPLSDEATVLNAGQHLTVRVRPRETVIRALEDEATISPPPSSLPPSRQPDRTPRASDPLQDTAPRPVASRTASGPAVTLGLAAPVSASIGALNWQAELVRGDFETIVRQAEHAGLETCLAQANSADLAALADAARYGRHDDIARRALLAQRRRFALSPAARDASFLLGRLEEAEQHGAQAIDWYDRYLAEAAAGTYASEALGRKMTLTQTVSGDERASVVAREYIDRFPQGTYAARARALARMP